MAFIEKSFQENLMAGDRADDGYIKSSRHQRPSVKIVVQIIE